MLYIKKESCSADIEEDIAKQINRPEWDKLPEVLGKEEAVFLRDEFFDRLNKDSIREGLLREQHGLCAYCMAELKNSGEVTIIEHLYPLRKSKTRAMDYQNWLAVCKGGQDLDLPDGEKRVCCCDHKKADTIVKLSPLNWEQMQGIAYFDDGTIFYRSANQRQNNIINHEINYNFGLNGKFDTRTGRSRKDTSTGIVKRRKDSYKAIFDLLDEKLADESLTKDFIVEYINDLTCKDNWDGFVGVQLFVLNDILSKL